jgi:hypothetical protein
MKELYKIEDYNAYIKAGVVSFETAKYLSEEYLRRSRLSYCSREALKGDISDEYKQYEDWYSYEIRDELGDDIADTLLETVYSLQEMNCVNKEYNNVFAAPTFQEVIDWLIDEYGVIISFAYIGKSNKFIFRIQYINKFTDPNRIVSSTEEFNTWQEAIDAGIQSIILNVL